MPEFKDLKGEGSPYGRAASTALAEELAKTGEYDVASREDVERTAVNLGLRMPLDGLVALDHVAGDVRATSFVRGEVVDYQVRTADGGKQALALVRWEVHDTASALPFNGAVSKGETPARVAGATNEALIAEAVRKAVANAFETMRAQSFATATIVRTPGMGAIVDRGWFEGFRAGDKVAVSRGTMPVCTGKVASVEPQRAEILFDRTLVSPAPGDRVRKLFQLPPLRGPIHTLWRVP